MKIITRAVVFGALVVAAGCNTSKTETSAAPEAAKATSQQAADPHAGLTNLEMDQVATLIKEKSCVPVDANKPETRKEFGTLPGAVLLSDYSAFNAQELPSDKSTKLVFYCGSQKCTAAPKAAELAKQAGYTDVNVMRDGIRGWVKAGHEVDKPTT